MSAESGGAAVPRNRGLQGLPVDCLEAVNAAKRISVPRKRDVEIVFTHQVVVDEFIDAIIALVGSPQQFECIQATSPKKFLVTFKSEELAVYFHQALAPSLNIPGATHFCKWLGAERKRVRVAFLPYAVPNCELINVLKKYGRVIQVTDETYPNRPFSIKTGTRLVDMEMTSSVPNIITVCGFSVPVTYRGVVIQCRRCSQIGHVKADCVTPYCDRCRTFGHSSNQCSAPCLKCKAPDHHWAECSVRSYALAAARNPGRSGTSNAAAVEDDLSCVPAANDVQITEVVLPLTLSKQGNGNDTTLNSGNECSQDGNTTMDAFDSATENSSETEGEPTGPGQTAPGAAASPNDCNIVTCEQTNTGADTKPEWETAKCKTRKRKKASLSSVDSPDHKKAAQDYPAKPL